MLKNAKVLKYWIHSVFSEAFSESQSDQIVSPEHEGDVLLQGIVACMNERKKGIQHGKD